MKKTPIFLPDRFWTSDTLRDSFKNASCTASSDNVWLFKIEYADL
jgi:hypothetical protein